MSVEHATDTQKVSHPPVKPKYGFFGPPLLFALKRPIVTVIMISAPAPGARQNRAMEIHQGRETAIYGLRSPSLHHMRVLVNLQVDDQVYWSTRRI